MKAKFNTRGLSVLFGFFSWKKNKVTFKSAPSKFETFEMSSDDKAFITQYKSFQYPDPETLPPMFDPQKDGN